MTTSPSSGRQPRWTAGLLLAMALTPAVSPGAIPTLQTRVLALHAEVEQQVPAAALTLYLGSEARGLWLRRITVRLDDRPPLVYEFSDVESRALRNGGAYRLRWPTLPASAQGLQIEVLARTETPRAATDHLTARFDHALHPGGSPLLSLALQRGPLGGLRLEPADAPLTAAAMDARYARFLDDSGQEVAAAAVRQNLAAEPAMQSMPLPDADDHGLSAYNTAVTALARGDAEEGLTTLERLATAQADDVEGLALRDAANLTLGYHHLRQRRGDAAIEALTRIRSPGPYDNRALLGLGWAWLLPAADDDGRPSFVGNLQQWHPGDSEAAPTARRDMPFRRHDALADRTASAQRLQRALIPWNELTGRDPLDPAVQEAALAIPYALAHLGAHEQAQQRWLGATTLLQSALAQLDTATTEVADGRLDAWLVRSADPAVAGHGWRRWLADLHRTPEAEWTLQLLDSPEVVTALDQLRDVHALQALVDTDIARLTPGDPLREQLSALRPALEVAVREQSRALASTARTVLDHLRAQTLTYLAEARYALARLHDRQLLAGAVIEAGDPAP